jgi:hypothetical protein
MRKELEKKLAVARSSERAEIVAELQSAMVWARKRRSQLLETMAAPTPSEVNKTFETFRIISLLLA